MDFTLVGLWNEMGLVARGVVVVLVAMSLYSLAITGDRLRTFWRGRQFPDTGASSKITKSASTCPAVKRWTRPARMPFKGAARPLSAASKAATPASWVSRCTKRIYCSASSGAHRC